ncbi:hypothetical protein Golomagni_07240, partial [Golovinomyces magnicellulatus]
MVMTSSSSDATPGSAVQYEYMFEDNKRPTKQLDALLRSIARYIALEIGDRHDLQLTPKKLAAFYKAVGGDYDSIFTDMPDSSISYIWQVTGCQHTLQPTEDDFAPPTVPALTPRGFCRWESVEILLGPEEHVPFMQYAVKNWDLRHPETGECFPVDLPADVFPRKPDERTDLWHRACGERLQREAAREKRSSSRQRDSDSSDPRFAHFYPPNASTGNTPQHRKRSSETDYFGRFANVNVPGRQGSKHGRATRSPEKPNKPFKETTPEERARRRSFSDFSSPPPSGSSQLHTDEDGYLDPSGRGSQTSYTRRHSHPRPVSSDDEDESPNYRPHRRAHAGGSP